jgi:hypothetical protein
LPTWVFQTEAALVMMPINKNRQITVKSDQRQQRGKNVLKNAFIIFY